MEKRFIYIMKQLKPVSGIERRCVMKEEYIRIEFEIVRFDYIDIVTTSNNDDNEGEHIIIP